jgi:6-phosphofructokinase 1
MARTRKRRIAILTGGGDCPGLNAVIRAVVKTAQNVHGWEVYGVRSGVEGFLMPGGKGLQRLHREDIAGILPRGGTIIGASSRCNIFAVPQKNGTTKDESAQVIKQLEKKHIDALITVGGDGTQTMARMFQDLGINVIGVPKTIDNDLMGTDRTFGFDTAVGVVSGAIDRLYTTAESHHRVMLVEVMGRDSGFIALHGGLAGGAEVILIPEIPYDPDRLAEKISARVRHGRSFSIVIVSEGARRPKGAQVYQAGPNPSTGKRRLGGISFQVAEELRERIDLTVRNVVLGHTQRGGTPSPYDRVLATAMGNHAVKLIAEGAFGRMVALKGARMSSVTLAQATRRTRKVGRSGDLVRAAREMGISFAAADGSDDAFVEHRQKHGAP